MLGEKINESPQRKPCLEQLRIEGQFQQALVLINALLTC